MNARSRSGQLQVAQSPLGRPRPRKPTRALARIGRYVLHPAIARGGMATVHAARLVAAEGVTRLVAVKRLHPHFIDDPEFVAMFHDEARIASRIHHPNVVPVLDVVRSNDEVILVQEYVHGVPLSHLFKLGLGGEPMPIGIATATIAGVLAGLHAAHEATDEMGEHLAVVHRDVSPQNILLSVDGVPRLVDFGIAKAKTSTHHTREGFFKGKLSYMSPEQIRAEPVSRQTDVYAAGVLLWELVANRKFYEGKSDADFVRSVASGETPSLLETLEPERDAISDERWSAILKLERIVNRAMATTEAARYPTALEMASELVDAVGMAPATEVAAWVRSVGADWLDERNRVLSANEEAYRASVASQRAARLVGEAHETSSQRRFTTSTPSSSIEVDSVVKSSGPRIRAFHDVVRDRSLPSGLLGETAPLLTLDGGASSPSSPPVASVRPLLALDPRTKALLPWVVIAGLLIVVGVLATMVIVRERPSIVPPAPSAMPPAPAASSMTDGATFSPPEPDVLMAPVVARAASAAASGASAAPSTMIPPTSLRWGPRAPLTPSTRATATPAASASACTPPFYFEGNKKIFKTNCL